MKKYLLLTLGMLAAVPSIHAYTAADFTDKIVGIIIGGSEIYSGKLVSLQQAHFERNGADNKVTLKNVVLWNHVYDVNFTISGSQLIMDFDSGAYFQSLTAKDNTSYKAQIREFQNGLNNSNANYASAYVYVPSNANHNQIAFSISDTGNGSYSLNFTGYFGVVNTQQSTLSATAQNARIFCNCTIHVYPQNALHYYKVSQVNDFAWNGEVEELPCRVSFQNANDGYNFHIYNWNGEGWAWDADQTGGGIGAVVGNYTGTTSSTSGSVTLPIQKYNYTTTITPSVYGQGTATCYKNRTNYGTGYAYSPTSSMHATSWTTTMIDADFNTLPVTGNYVRGIQHAGFTDVPQYLWDQGSEGRLVTQNLFKLKFGTWCEYEESYDITTRAYESIVEAPNGDSQPVTLSAENTLQRYAFHGDNVNLQQFGLYVGGKFKLTNAQYYDHMELYVVSEKTRSITGKSLDATKGLANAINITDEISWFQWPSTDLGALPNTWGHTHHGATDEYLDPAQWTQEDRDYVNARLLAAPDANGYVYYNHLVTPERLGWSTGSNSPAKRVNAASIPGYSVFAKVYYKTASGLQPTFHGLQYLDNATTSIEDLETGRPAEPVTVLGHYDVAGRAIDAATPGIHIVRMSDGTSRKEIVR